MDIADGHPEGTVAGDEDPAIPRKIMPDLEEVARIPSDDGPIAATDTLLLGLSSRIAAQDVTRTGLAAIAQNAEATLLTETGVDLDTEAANLIRLQQAFEANSRVLQVAADIFDTLLGLR